MERLTARLGKVMTDENVSKDAAATRIQAHYRGHIVRKAYKLYKIGGAISEVLYSPAAYGVDLSSRNAPKPRARINSNACVVKNTLWLFGGAVEISDKEVSAQSACGVAYQPEVPSSNYSGTLDWTVTPENMGLLALCVTQGPMPSSKPRIILSW
jgi:hypothetical protein